MIAQGVFRTFWDKKSDGGGGGLVEFAKSFLPILTCVGGRQFQCGNFAVSMENDVLQLFFGQKLGIGNASSWKFVSEKIKSRVQLSPRSKRLSHWRRCQDPQLQMWWNSISCSNRNFSFLTVFWINDGCFGWKIGNLGVVV